MRIGSYAMTSSYKKGMLPEGSSSRDSPSNAKDTDYDAPFSPDTLFGQPLGHIHGSKSDVVVGNDEESKVNINVTDVDSPNTQTVESPDPLSKKAVGRSSNSRKSSSNALSQASGDENGAASILKLSL